MRFLLKVNIPVEVRKCGSESRKAWCDYPIDSRRFEAGDRLLYGRQRSAHRIYISRYAGCLANPGDR